MGALVQDSEARFLSVVGEGAESIRDEIITIPFEDFDTAVVAYIPIPFTKLLLQLVQSCMLFGIKFAEPRLIEELRPILQDLPRRPTFSTVIGFLGTRKCVNVDPIFGDRQKPVEIPRNENGLLISPDVASQIKPVSWFFAEEVIQAEEVARRLG